VTDERTLSTEDILREISNLKENIDTRLTSMDRAVTKFNEDFTRVPTSLDKAITQLQALLAERFNGVQIQFDGVQKQFSERDVRVNQAATTAKTAVDAALSAQKEAANDQNKSLILSINKSEQSTASQLEQQRVVLIAVEKTLSDKIGDVADRLNRWEGSGQGKAEVSAPLWAMASAILTALLITGIMAFLNKSDPVDKLTPRLDTIEQTLLRHDSGKAGLAQ
jgi:hypothetical protein